MRWWKRSDSTLLLLVGLFLLGAPLAAASTVVVPPGGSIADALAGALPGDTVLLECGLYREQNIIMPEGVILRSESGQAGCVTILSDGSGPILRCEGLTNATRVEGLILQLDPLVAEPAVVRGGGVYCEESSPVFLNCRFVQLTAAYGGAVFARSGANPTFENCFFRGNRAWAVGGAVACVDNCRPRLIGCLVAGNAAAAGGAFNAANGSHLALDHCTVADNEAEAGAALSFWKASADTLVGSILVDGQLWVGDVGSFLGAECSNIFSGGPVPVDPDLFDFISADPLFCANLAGDYRYSLDTASPCTPEAAPACGGMGAMPTGCAMSPVAGPDPALPRMTRLQDAFPNPFNPRTTVNFEVSRPGRVTLAVFDLAGRLVNRLVDETLPAGRHQAVWSGTSLDGRQVAAGVYFLRLKSADAQDTRRVMLVK